MADGNLVVTDSEGMESISYFAEPVGFLFRREFTFDDERTAESLSDIYDMNFEAKTLDNGNTVFEAEEFPGLEVKVIRYGYTKIDYLETDINYVLTSSLIEKHKDIFDDYGVELVSYPAAYGLISENEASDCLGVMIEEDNIENTADAIAEFIRLSLTEDKRADGESCYKSVSGNITLFAEDPITGGQRELGNLSFDPEPDHSWVLDENVTNEEVRERIRECYDQYFDISDS